MLEHILGAELARQYVFIIQFCFNLRYMLLTLYLIEKPFNTFANRAGPDQAALVRSA